MVFLQGNYYMVKQRTLQKMVQAAGIGLHSGDTVLLTLRPAPINTGIVFRREDLDLQEIPAVYDSVKETLFCTSLVHNGAKVATVEHVLSALSGLHIDNLYVDVNAQEIPIMDGSAAAFVALIQAAGISEQDAPKKFLRILKPVRVEEKGKYVELLPYEGFKVSFTIDFDHPAFRDIPQKVSMDISSATYIEHISNARTFGFLSEYEKLRELGLAKGGSLDNAIVVDQEKVINEGGLRFDAEFVTHKILDVIGDLYLLGCGLIGAFDGYRSGHELNNRLLHALMQNKDAWEYVSFDEGKGTPVFLL